MKLLALLRTPTNYEAFTAGPIKFLSYVAITVTSEPSLAVKIYRKLAFTNTACIFSMITAYVALGCGTLSDRFAVISTLNYYFIALGKAVTLNYFNSNLMSTFEDFKNMSPSVYHVHQYGLENHLRNYKMVENFIYNFFKYICLLIALQPLIESFVLLWMKGEFGYLLIVSLWPEVPLQNGYFLYGFYYVLSCFSTHFIGFTNISTDLTLISYLAQLCVHFDLIAKRIVELKPENEESLENLNKIIKYHQRVLKLSKKVNLIFAPTIAFSLFSSSFILCFVAYQMLDDVSAIEVMIAFLVLCYELKQVVLICYYGDKLIESSAEVFNALYIHEWYNGSLKYRRQVVFLLMATRDSVAIRIAGVINVSFITLRQVFSNAYQIFALLKTT